MVFEFVEYVLGKGGITCMQTKCIGGQTLLHHAVMEGKADLCNLGKESADLCNLLIQSGAELDATNVYGETPLGTAIRTSNLDLVKLLLKHGANPNCGESFGSAPPLHMAIIIMAAKEGSADVCNLLIKSGAEIDATDVDGETPLGTAIKTSNLDLVKLLLKRGANPNCGECLHLAVKKGGADLCNLLIKSGAELDATNVYGETPLGTAIKTSNLDLVKLLLKLGANPNCGECLHLAVKKGSADVCNLLIKSGAEIDATNVHGETPLGTATKTSNLDLVKLLLKRGANPNCEECLHLAVEKGRADMCELLIDSGAKLDAMNANKDTPLLIAIRNNNLELVKLLLKRGANPNCGEYLHLNVKKGSADVCNLLIKSGAEIDATNVHGETPLGTAIKTSNLDLVKLLLKRGANPNCGACLHLAVEKERMDLCELFIDSGANLDAMNAIVNFLLVKAQTDPNCGRKRRRNAEEHETVILQEKMDLDNATLSVLKRCRISKDAMSK
ncbi:putative ankyrin repeat protein RF_0381 [Artemia franciscana]